jgi:hypothetical protein
MKGIEKDHAKDSYNSIDINKYFDNIYARSFGLLDTPGFPASLVASLQTLVTDYRARLISVSPSYSLTFKTPFLSDLLELFEIHRNLTLQLDVHTSQLEYPEKMRMLFEDGELIRHVLGLGFVPYASQLIFEMHQHSQDAFTVVAKYNWQEVALGGACGEAIRCPYEKFVQYVADNTVNATVYMS